MVDKADRRLLRLLESAPDALLCAALNGRIALVSAQVERLSGYARVELIGQQVQIPVPDAARRAHPRRRGERAADPRPQPWERAADPRPQPWGAGMELAGRRRDGSALAAEISLPAIDSGEAFSQQGLGATGPVWAWPRCTGSSPRHASGGRPEGRPAAPSKCNAEQAFNSMARNSEAVSLRKHPKASRHLHSGSLEVFNSVDRERI